MKFEEHAVWNWKKEEILPLPRNIPQEQDNIKVEEGSNYDNEPIRGTRSIEDVY